MNSRREALKVLFFGSAAMGASRYVDAMPLTPLTPGYPGIPLSSPCSPPDEPPKDLRSPLQVYQDDIQNDVKQIIDYDNSPYWKHARRVNMDVFRALEDRLIAEGKDIVRLEGVNALTLVINGNVIVAL